MTIEGYSILRLLSERERSKLFLARDSSGNSCAVKLQKSRDPSHLAELTRRNARLQPLTRHTSLVEILAYGATEDGWAWKALRLADNLPGLPPVDTAEGQRQYTPMTLLALRADKDRPGANTVAQWGVRLAEALTVLHRAGLVHRDVKPANVLFIGGEPCLGDYGLVSQPGDKVDYRGTEGYQPLEGTSDGGADLFALGKTLYEVWTGENRLEFPSLPRAVLEAPDWSSSGSHFNEVILHACHVQPGKRFRSAEEFSSALAAVIRGRRPINRRRWLLTGAGLVGLGTGLFLFLKYIKAPARVVWRRVRSKGFNVESWAGHSGTADWTRGQLYSFCVDLKGRVFLKLDLARFDLAGKVLEEGPAQSSSSLFHPQTRELWIIDGGKGEVFALDPETYKLRSLGGGPSDDRHFGARTYWNPLTGRVGILGGYGYFAVRNDRCEFDPASKQWIEIEPDREDRNPWRRSGATPLIPDPTGRKLFLVGGGGSRSGKQGERTPGLPGFTGQFHFLDDIWELDLETNTWRCLLPLGHFDPARLQVAAYFPKVHGLVLLEGMKLGDPHPASPRAWLLRPGIDSLPVRLPSVGDASFLAQVWAYTMDPNNGELLLFVNDGIFRLALERT